VDSVPQVVPVPQSERMMRVGVVVHELMHHLKGLDHTMSGSDAIGSDRSAPLGSWGLFQNPWGFGGDQRCPPLLNPVEKMALGYYGGNPMELTRASHAGMTLTLNPRHLTNPTAPQLYQVKEGFSAASESLLVEYMTQEASTVTECLPVRQGLALWRVSDQNGVQLIQADGMGDLEARANLGDMGDLFGPDRLGRGIDITSPATDSVMGHVSGLALTELDFSLDNSMTFRVEFAAPTSAPSMSLAPSHSSAPSHAPADAATEAPSVSFQPTTFPSESPSNMPSMVVPESCPAAGQHLFTFEITTDLWGSQTTWELVDVKRGGTVLLSGGPYADGAFNYYRYGMCVDDESCYKIVIKDSNADGLFSVMDGNGYKAIYDGMVVDESRITSPELGLGNNNHVSQ
jgi:hypothetical protein